MCVLLSHNSETGRGRNSGCPAVQIFLNLASEPRILKIINQFLKIIDQLHNERVILCIFHIICDANNVMTQIESQPHS